MQSVVKGKWQPIDAELVQDGYIARVTRHILGGRWRWAVTPLEVAQRWNMRVVEHAYARGYAKSYDRAIEMAEAAIVALKAAKKKEEIP